MGTRMTNDIEALGVTISNDTEHAILIDHKCRIDQLPIHLASQSGSAKPRTDIGGYVEDADRSLKQARTAIRQSNRWHGLENHRVGVWGSLTTLAPLAAQ